MGLAGGLATNGQAGGQVPDSVVSASSLPAEAAYKLVSAGTDSNEGEWVPDSGGTPKNWCAVYVSPAGGPLTPGSPSYRYQEADFSIGGQSGSDFSLGSDGGGGNVISAGGGFFQGAIISNAAYDATLDGSSAAQRWLGFSAVFGPNGPDGLFNALGVDGFAPILPGVANVSQLSVTAEGAPAYVPPGGPTLNSMLANLIGGVGTDSVPLDQGPFAVYIWQIG